jgi:hypothetical protein
VADTLTPFAENIWTIESSLPVLGSRMGLRSTLIRHASGQLTMISPVKMSEKLRAQIAVLGEVENIVAPNGFHHLYVPAARRAFPEAKAYASPALFKKRPDIAWTGEIPLHGFHSDLLVTRLEGQPAFQEHVFFHTPSKTLIVTDLVFNLGRLPGWGSLLFRLFGTYNRPAISRLFWLFTRDKALMRESLKSILAWPFESIVMAHGEPIRAEAREVFLRILRERRVL